MVEYQKYLYKVSIIVPCYNTNAWIDECLQSLVDQALQGIEIICVNDGSTDGTGDRLDEWQAQYPNKIKVIHQQNSGLSNARNAGMAIAQGECIGFVDSDDFVDASMYEKLYNTYKNNKADIAMCEIISFIQRPEKLTNKRTPSIIESIHIDTRTNYHSVPVGLYSSFFLQQNNIAFAPNLLYEDISFQHEISIYLPVAYKTTEILYFHRKNRLNQITSLNGMECFDILSVFDYLHLKLYKHNNYHTIYYLLLKRYISLTIVYLFKIKKHKVKFLFNSAYKLFSKHKILNIYKSAFNVRYKKNYSYSIAPIFIAILHLCYLISKIKFIKI